MLENWDQFKAAFLPYLREFLARANAEKPELSQVPIPTSLQSVCAEMGTTLKTSFGMGTPTLIPWLACFLPGQSAGKDGVYPVILFRRDTRSLSVCFGVSATAQATDGKWPRKWPDALVKALPHFSHEKYGASYEFRSFGEASESNLEEIASAFASVISSYLLVPV